MWMFLSSVRWFKMWIVTPLPLKVRHLHFYQIYIQVNTKSGNDLIMLQLTEDSQQVNMTTLILQHVL